ncbi:TonB-dependent receptor [Sphingomonas koreensis]|nr:TonB-dependent receptor [Sphingomonas koreensis]
MTTTTKFMRKNLRAGSALQALALLGAGVVGSAAFVAPAAAQDYTTGSIVGSVHDETGANVGGGTATIVSNEQGFTRTATIQSDGSFRVPQLPTGTYAVTVDSPTGSPVTDNNISVTAGSSNTYVFTVSTGAASDIVVTGTAVKGNDFSATTSGLTLDVQQLVQNVPVNRDATSLILLAPATNTGDTGFGNFASIGGGAVSENQYYVNGLNITDFRDFIAPSKVPFEFYRTYNVQTGGLTAEFGRALGGVTNAVTQSGSNHWRAGAVFAWEPSQLYSQSPNTYSADNKDDFRSSTDTTFYLSGPIIKNHLFFYALYNPQHEVDGDSSISSRWRINSITDTPFIGGKVDAVITDGQRLEFTYFRDKGTTRSKYFNYDPDTDLVGGTLGDVTETTGGDNFIGTYTGAFTDWFTLSASYGENHRQDRVTSVPNLALVQSNLTGISTIASGVSSAQQGNEDVRKVWRVDADVYAHFLGDHHFRVGYDNENLKLKNDVVYTGSGYRYVFQPTYIQRYFYRNQGQFQSKQAAFYAEDSWTLFNNRVNLQLGIRDDKFQNYNVAGKKYYESGDQWGPRGGVSFDVFGDKRTKISAYFGRYFQPIATNTNIREAGDELYYQQRFAYPNGVNPANFAPDGTPIGETFDPVTGDPAIGGTLYTGSCGTGGPDTGTCAQTTSDGTLHDTSQLVAEGLKPSYSDEIKVGASQRLGDWTFGVNWIHRRLGRTLEDIAVDAGIIGYCNANGIEGCADVYTGFTQYVVSNPGTDVTVVPLYNVGGLGTSPITLKAEDLGFPKAVRKYDTYEFTFDKPFNGTWSLAGSYSYTKLRGNYEGSVDSTIDQTDTGITQDFDQPGLLEGAYGDLANGRAHQLKIYGAYQVLPWLQFSGNLSLASPRKFSCIGNYPDPNNFASGYGAFSYYCQQPSAAHGGAPFSYTDSNGDTVTTGSYLVPRGSAFQGQWFKQLDIGVKIDVPGLDGAAVRADVFNVFNWQDKLDFNEFGDLDFAGPNDAYRLPTGYTQPRYVRLTFSLRFGENGQSLGGSDE